MRSCSMPQQGDRGAEMPTFTQADMTEMRRSESLEASADASRRLFPSYIAKAYRCMLSHVVVRFSNVIHTEELALWKAVLMDSATAAPHTDAPAQGPPTNHDNDANSPQHHGAPTMLALAMEDLVLRLACRKPQWFAIARLHNSYADRLASYVNRVDAEADGQEHTLYQVVDALCSRPIVDGGGANGGSSLGATMLTKASGGDLVDAIAHGDLAAATAMLQCIRRAELKELAIHLRRHAVHATTESVATAMEPTSDASSVVDRRVGSGSRASKQQAPSSTTATTIIPDAKGPMIAYILKHAPGDAMLANVWDATVGAMVSVNPTIKHAVQQLLCWFHIATEYAPSTSSSSSTTTPPLPTSNIAVLATLGRLRLPMQGVLPAFAFQDAIAPLVLGTALNFNGDGVGGSIVGAGGNERLLLFSTRMELDLFVDGLRLRCDLFEACEGYARYKMRDAAFAHDAVTRVEAAMQTLHNMAKRRHAQDAMYSDRMWGAHRRQQRKRQRNDDDGVAPEPLTWLTVPHALYRYGYDAYHLTRFLPLYQWMHCAEYLCEVLQAQRQYERANQFLRILLEHPVFELHATVAPTGAVAARSSTSVPRQGRGSSGTMAVVAMCYRYQARGKWWHRLGQNLCQLGLQAQALRLMEQTLDACTGTLVDDAETKRMADRLERIMRGRWDACRCLRTASVEGLHKRFLRRADRMTMERLQVRLHKPPRRWGALPPNLLVACVRTAPPLYINGHRDLLAGGWNDEALSKASCRVESHVLRWFERGRGRREAGWRGAHCEGSWIAALTEVVFLEAFVWHPDADAPTGGARTPAGDAVLAPHLWLTPFQARALDANSLVAFSQRRAPIIRRCIESLRGLSQAAFVAFVTERTTISTVAQDDGDGDDGDGDDGDVVCDEDAPQDVPTIEEQQDSADGCRATEMAAVDTLTACDDCAVEDPPDWMAEKQFHDSSVAARRPNLHEGADDDDVLLFDDDANVDHTIAAHQGHQGDEERSETDAGPQLHMEEAQRQPASPGDDADPTTTLPPLPSLYRVDIAHVPQLREMAACIPIAALCALFETMFFSNPSEGHMLRFSGWPDLAVWRRPQPPRTTSAGSVRLPAPPEFKLVEVKSPSDKLSDKQIAVNDLLLRSGFDVSVACVVNNTVIAATKAPRTRLISRYTPDIAPVQMTRRTSSSFVRGSATNPVLL